MTREDFVAVEVEEDIVMILAIGGNKVVTVRPIIVLQEVPWAEVHVIHPVVMPLQHHVLVLGIVPQEAHCQVQYVIHSPVTEPQLRVRIPVPQEGLYQVPHVRVLKVRPRIIHVRQVVPYQVPHVRFPQEGHHNMGVRWGEVWWGEDANFLRDNVCDDSCVDKCV